MHWRDDPVGLAMRIVDDTRDELEKLGRPGEIRIPDVSFEAAETSAECGRELIARIDALDLAALPEALQLGVGVARAHAAGWAVRADWYWTVFDPMPGMFGMFAPAPYGGGFTISAVANQIRQAPVDSEGARHRYLAALHDMAAMIDAFAERTRGQAARGIFIPRPQAVAVIDLLDRLKAQLPPSLHVGDDRLTKCAGFKRDAARITSETVGASLSRLRDMFDPAYLGQCGEAVGLMHFPDGADIYAALVRHHGSTELRPEEIHRIGLERMVAVRAGMAEARAQAGFDGDDHAYRVLLDSAPEWRADTPEAIQSHFEGHIARLKPHLADLFSLLPSATYWVRPLPDSLSEAMTFGYYDAPTPSRRHGDYVFNARNLAQSGLYHLASLTYHELVPGHHLHLALQGENQALPAIRKSYLPTAYTEGWAEYAVTLAEEAGLYDTPAERFGRLKNEAFLTCRLVVDTGMNAMGWSLAQARDYMRQHSFFPDTEICSETLRYSCDIPGQALAYKLGEIRMMRLRAAMKEQLGDRFRLRDFHETVLAAGALPLELLADHVARQTRIMANEVD